MLEEPVLATLNLELLFEVETDALEYALGGVLEERQEDKIHKPVALFSKKLYGPELNYPIYDKELTAIIEAFKGWRHYLSGADHKNLTTLTTIKDLNKR